MTNTLLETRINEYLAYRRSLGYRMTFHETTLRSFARFAASHKYRGRLKADWIEEFAYAPEDAHPAYRRQLHRVLSDFARHWAVYDSHVEIPAPCEPGASYRRSEPYIYSDTEVRSLITAARSCRPRAGATHATVIGLMACTGLRTGEAVALRKEDVDFGNSLLRVHNSKSRILRLVPIHQSTVKALQAYAQQRDAQFPQAKTDHFFLSRTGRPLSRKDVSDNFARVRQRAGIVVPTGRRRPRAYDLRHTFACNCLASWLQAGRDVSRSIHYLATYLGHEGVKETYWYLTSTPLLLETVGQHFERYAAQEDGRAFQ